MSIWSGRRGNVEERLWRSQVKPSGKSRTTPPCSSNYLRLGCTSQAFTGGKIGFHFQSLLCFSFTSSLGFNKIVQEKLPSSLRLPRCGN